MCSDPPDAARTHDYEVVAKVSVGRFEEKRQKRREHTVRSGGIGFDSNDAGMRGERKNRPVAEMLVQGDEEAAVGDCVIEDLRVAGAGQTYLARSHYVMPDLAERTGYRFIQHLVEQQR